MKEIVIRIRTGFERDDGCARYRYDFCGRYLGQYQDDMLGSEPDAGSLWLPTSPGDKCYHELSSKQTCLSG